MKVVQNNSNNVFGFSRHENTDTGVDESGNVARGYQHHDAMWWKESPMERSDATTTLELEPTVAYFESVFSNIASNIISCFNPKTVLDLGCGSGHLTYLLRKLNNDITTVTVDANRDTKLSPYIDHNHFIARTDKELDFTYENGEKVFFDLIISLEHFEHVPEDTFDMLMSNVVNHSLSGSSLVFTAAEWQYDDKNKEHVHCNLQDTLYWIDYIKDHGFFSIPNPFPLNRAGDTAEVFSIRI